MQNAVRSEVLVVGAGPVGLTLANALAHHGVTATVVDSRHEPRTQSRANNLYARPQELLAAVGLRDLLADGAHRVSSAQFVMNGRSIDTVGFDDASLPYPAVLYSSQAVMERTMRDALTGRGRPVEGGVTLVGLEQDATGVDAELETADGHRYTHRARYVVGTDGANSAVRRAVRIELEVEDFPRRATRQIDARLSWRRPTTRDTMWFFVYENGFAGVLPIEGDCHRLFFVEDDEGMPEREPTVEEMQDRAREVTGDPTVTLTDPIWASHTRFRHGVASAHAVGRVFLAGDAGHLNLPIGGQGMNAGMQDAVTLAWRLAMTLAGRAAPAVLASYATERHGEHRRLGRQEVSGFRRLMYRSGLQDKVLDVAAAAVPEIGKRLLGAEELQQLAVAYPDSPLSVDHRPRRPGRRVAAGHRAPDSRVVRDDRTTTLFEQIYNPDGLTWGWALLAFEGPGDDRAELAAAVEAVTLRHPWVRARLVRNRPDGPAAPDEVPVLWDLDGQAHSAYGTARSATLVLVRPDGHVGLLAPADRGDALLTYCGAIDPTHDRRPAELAHAGAHS
ncbi:FAD-dependent monooxygenase [Actinomycetospora atypica]|uniref:FAD-dependent monooxygenase n=1 Tax=Actinomycetospora atypica TaxID=1290095 RepID=A0ABV9YSX0_9PSEU